MRSWLSVIFSMICLAGTVSASAADAAWSADERAVAATDTAFYAASREKQGLAWAKFADDSATTQVGHGKAEIGAAYEKLYAQPGFPSSRHPVFTEVVGDVGVTSGPYELHLQDALGRDKRSTGNYVTVWRRQKDGPWRFVWDGGTPDK